MDHRGIVFNDLAASHVVVNFIGDINARENSVEEIEAAKLGQNNKRRLLQRSRFETVSSLTFLFQVLKAVPQRRLYLRLMFCGVSCTWCTRADL